MIEFIKNLFRKPRTVDDIIADSFWEGDRWTSFEDGWKYRDNITWAVLTVGRSNQVHINDVLVSPQVSASFHKWRYAPMQKVIDDKQRELESLYTMIHPTQPWPKK